MSEGYRKLTIDDVVHEIYDAPHATPEKTEEGPIFLGVSNLVNGRLDLSDTEHVSEEGFQKRTSRVTPHGGDIVFSYETRLGEVALIPENLKCCLGRRMGLLRVDREVADPRYLLYAWLSPEFQRTIHAQASQGSTVNRILLTELGNYPIRVPPLPVQRRIADILGALDDKIELNRRMNETLEEMAQALYRHWFVDFGPFQDRELKDTEEMGPIPKGWEIKPFLDTCEIETGGTPKTSVDEYWGGDILWASAKDVSQSTDAVLLDPERTVTPAGIENSPADVLPAGTTAIVARGATTGRHAILGRDMALNQSCYGLIGKDGYSWGWTYLTVDSLVKRLRKHAYGSAFDSVTISTFENLDIVGAPPEVISAFKEKVMPLFKKMMANVKENQTLAEIRDYLLPKLISGEIEVGAAEEVVEAKT
jgi:type I restriction enzyme S subunit